MSVPTRHAFSNEYRYGFQGQEKDDEIKEGDGNSLNYKYRMHDPRIGRFFAVDPLSDEFSWNSPYAFAENMLGLGVELEGKELGYEDGKLIYRVHNGYGPTQIAKYLNSEKEKYGFGGAMSLAVTWVDVVSWNLDTFVEKGVYKDMTNVGDKGYNDLNINPQDILQVNFLDLEIDERKPEYVDYGIRAFTSPIGGISGSAGITAKGVAANVHITTIPSDIHDWNAGGTVIMGGINFAIQSGKFNGTGNAEVSLEGGIFHVYSTKSSSINDILNGDSSSKTIQWIAPSGWGGKYSNTTSDGYNINLIGPSFGTPTGWKPTIQFTSSKFGETGFKILNDLKDLKDSLDFARKKVIKFPNSSIFQKFIDENDIKTPFKN